MAESAVRTDKTTDRERNGGTTINQTNHERMSTMKGVLLSVAMAVVIAVPTSSFASSSRCAAFFSDAQAPDLTIASLTTRTHVLCFQFYSVLESGITRTPLWSAEHLTRNSVASAHEEKRVDAFHAEGSIDSDDRAEIADYRASGYDRGHMSPSGDMPDAAAQEESFSLANMVPQAPDNNRHLWQGIEIATRALAKADGELYVVTGPSFVGPRSILDARVEIPSHIWKAIYDPRRGAAAYVTANRPGNGYAVVSIATLKHITGIDPFPSLSDALKSQAIALPPPRPSGRRLKAGPVDLATLGLSGDAAGAMQAESLQTDSHAGDSAFGHASAGASDGASLAEGIFAANRSQWPASEAELFGKVPMASRLQRLGDWLQHFAVAERVAAITHALEAATGYVVQWVKKWSTAVEHSHAEKVRREHEREHKRQSKQTSRSEHRNEQQSEHQTGQHYEYQSEHG